MVRPSIAPLPSQETSLRQQLINSLQGQVSTLQEQVQSVKREKTQLQDMCRENSMVNLIVFCTNNDISVAVVSNCSASGLDLFARWRDTFSQNRELLHRQGMAFAVLEEVPMNLVQETPFPQ